MAEDTSLGDLEYTPSESEDRDDSQPWLNLLDDAEKKFRDWQEHADRIDELFSDLERWAAQNRDREFAMFWANMGVLAPTVYTRKPIPVAAVEFGERDPVKRAAAEMLERALIKSWDLDYFDGTMRLTRDDMLIDGRGVIWVRKEEKGEGNYPNGGYERLCNEFLDRKDFRHGPARIWPEVPWVARCAWLTRRQAQKRFEVASGDAYLDASYVVARDGGRQGKPDEGTSPQEKAPFWEIWHKEENEVVWVSEGVDVVLDRGPPHHKLDGFFPCPRPAYCTLQRRTLIPVPDIVFYRDQLEEINTLTARIHALSDAIQVKGFYPGGGEIGDAVEAALNLNDNRRIMIPVSNFAAFGQRGDPIVWMPIDMIAETIVQLVNLRRQVIDDVYQIVGLADIMRGTVDPEEKLGQSQLKSQYGSIRIRDRQYELVRIARDVARIDAEIMAEEFSRETLLALSQMQLPTRAENKKKIAQIELMVKQQAAQLQAQLTSPQAQQMAQENPEEAKAALEQLQAQAQEALDQAKDEIDEIALEPTIEDVLELLRDQRLRPFALDIETDSTIQPDEDAEKQRRTEFLGVFGGLMAQLAQLIEVAPQSAELCGDILKFGLAPYRAGRSLEGSIDKFVDQITQQAGQQGQQESPEQMKARMDGEAKMAELQMRDQESQRRTQVEMMKLENEQVMQEREGELKREEMMLDSARKDKESQQRLVENTQKHQAEMQKLQVELVKISKEIEMADHKIAAGKEEQIMKRQAQKQDMMYRERDAQRQDRMAERTMIRDDRSAQRQGDLAERTANAKMSTMRGNGSSPNVGQGA